jgi:hypothetical protein
MILEKNAKTSPCGLPDLQLASCSIKINSEVFGVCQKKKSLPASNSIKTLDGFL